MQKIILISFIVVIGFLSIHAQAQARFTVITPDTLGLITEDDEGGPEVEEAGVLHDTTSYEIPECLFLTASDSMFLIPAYTMYPTWDTMDIHPYQFDLTRKKDTTYLFLEDHYTCEYEHPIHGAITSHFGPRRSRYHFGTDVKLETGDPVKAAFSGKVRISRYSSSYGYTVVIRHHNGLETLYAHLSELSVAPGDDVEIGEVIGLGGNTGRSTGPHLHFEVRYRGEPINPEMLIDFDCGELRLKELPVSASLFGYLKEIRSARYHTVRSGETLSHIARRYGTSVNRILKLNKLRATSIIRPGQRIRYS